MAVEGPIVGSEFADADLPGGSTEYGGEPPYPNTQGAPPQFQPFMAGATFMPETSVDVRFEYHPGERVQDACAADGAPGERVKIHAGYWTKVISWDYERLNDWPLCPHPDTGDPNDVLIYASVQPAKPQDGPSQRVFRVTGEYHYRLLRPLADWGPFPTARSPETTASQHDNMMPAVAFEYGALFGAGSFKSQQ